MNPCRSHKLNCEKNPQIPFLVHHTTSGRNGLYLACYRTAPDCLVDAASAQAHYKGQLAPNLRRNPQETDRRLRAAADIVCRRFRVRPSQYYSDIVRQQPTKHLRFGYTIFFMHLRNLLCSHSHQAHRLLQNTFPALTA